MFQKLQRILEELKKSCKILEELERILQTLMRMQELDMLLN